MKVNESTHKVHVKARENNRQSICEHDEEFNEIDQSCKGVIGAFGQKKLRIIDANCNFVEREEEQGNRTVFNKYVKLAIERNEAIAATDASVKDRIMEGVWEIEDDHGRMSMCGRIWSRNWNKSTDLATEAATLLDLFEAKEISMRGHDNGKITTHTDCIKAWEMVAANSSKASQLEGDAGSIVSRIIEIESKSKIDFEHAHINAKKI